MMQDVRAADGARRLMAIIAVASIVGCASLRGDEDAQRLAGADWRLSELSGRAAVPLEVSRRPWLRFELNRFAVEGDTLLLLRAGDVVGRFVR